MLILLPPSEGKWPGGRGRPLDLDALSSPGLRETRDQVLTSLHKVSASPDACATLGLSEGQKDQLDLNLGLRTAGTARADRIYTGVLYDALGFASLSQPARRRATSRVAIVSSVFGLLRPHDRIPAYRLPGGVQLPGLGTVAAQWREPLGPAVTAMVKGGLLVDLRSSTYAAFWRPDPDLGRRAVSVRVLHEVAGRRSVVSHFNKATKGRIVRALLEDGAAPRSPGAFADTLRRLGWSVEPGPATRTGTTVDVVVTSI
ncbi:MAG: peroxide stress protein YaaA [Nocardioides sp.]